jgi:hypothetical protein
MGTRIDYLLDAKPTADDVKAVIHAGNIAILFSNYLLNAGLNDASFNAKRHAAATANQILINNQNAPTATQWYRAVSAIANLIEIAIQYAVRMHREDLIPHQFYKLTVDGVTFVSPTAPYAPPTEDDPTTGYVDLSWDAPPDDKKEKNDQNLLKKSGSGKPPSAGSSGGGSGGGSPTSPIHKRVQLPSTNKQVIGFQGSPGATGGKKGLPAGRGRSGGGADPWQQSGQPSTQPAAKAGDNGRQQVGGGNVDPQHTPAQPQPTQDHDGPAGSEDVAPNGNVDASGGDAVVIDDGSSHTVTFTGTDDDSGSSGSIVTEDTMTVDSESTTYESGEAEGGYSESTDPDPKGGGDPNPDDGTDESGRMRGLPRYVSRRRNTFTGKGAVPGQTSAVYRLLAFSSAGLGDDGGGVNPRFFGSDPNASRSANRAGRVAEPDDGGGGDSGNIGWQAPTSGGAGDGALGAAAGGDLGTLSPQTYGSVDDAGSADNVDVSLPSGPDPDNEWGAGGYNPHYQPWGGYVWTPYSRGGAVGTTRAAPVLPAHMQRLAAIRFK